MTFPSIDCLYTNTSHLEVSFRADVIKPGKTLEIPITFYPRESINYQELIPFEINALSQQTVEIKGKGTEMKVSDYKGGPQGGSPSCSSSLLCQPESALLSSLSMSSTLGLLYQRSTRPTKMVTLISQRGELSNQTQVNRSCYSAPKFTISGIWVS